MKSYTDLEQSKKLAEILPLESADGFYEAQINPFTNKWEDILFVGNEWASDEVVIPAWSLAALLNVLELPTLEKCNIGKDKTGWMVTVYHNNSRYDSFFYNEPVDACYEVILKLNELKML